jgi:hypothetical protein
MLTRTDQTGVVGYRGFELDDTDDARVNASVHFGTNTLTTLGDSAWLDCYGRNHAPTTKGQYKKYMDPKYEVL